MLPILKNMVWALPIFKAEKKGVCKGCALGQHVKDVFLAVNIGQEGFLT